MIAQCVTVQPKPGQQLPTLRALSLLLVQKLRRLASLSDTPVIPNCPRSSPVEVGNVHQAPKLHLLSVTDVWYRVQELLAAELFHPVWQSLTVTVGGGGSPPDIAGLAVIAARTNSMTVMNVLCMIPSRLKITKICDSAT